MAKKRTKQAGSTKSKARAKKVPSKKAPATKKGAGPSRKKAASRSAPRGPQGPLTLEEASALVRGTGPATRSARAVRGTESGATLASVGKERKELVAQQREEVRQRERDYDAIYRLMNKHGVRGLAGDGTGDVRARGSANVLRVLAEGDSWFSYPAPLFGGGIIPRLEKRLGVPVMNLATAGDEVRAMLGVEQRKKLVERLRTKGAPWDVLVFSGGGNDIVGDPMALWIKDHDASQPAAEHINEQRFSAALAIVQAGYEDLIQLRNELSPNTQLIFHAYDFPIPDGRGICHLGPWLRPSLLLRGFRDEQRMFDVTKTMLSRFAGMLDGLARSRGRVTFLNGQGSLAPTKSSWHNELHPSKSGYDLFAAKFHEKIAELFPGRVRPLGK